MLPFRARADGNLPVADFWLRQYVAAQIGDTDHLDDRVRIGRLRDWVYGTIPIGYLTCALRIDAGSAELLRRIVEGRGGYLCGGTATVLRDLYRLFGYESDTYNMGFESESATHVVTVVAVEESGRRVLSVQDSYFGAVYLDRNGRLIGLPEILDALAEGAPEKVVVETRTPKCKLLMAPLATLRDAMTRIEFQQGKRLPDKGENAEFCGRFDMAHYYAKPRFDKALLNHAGSQFFAWLFAFPIGDPQAEPMKGLVMKAREIDRSRALNPAAARK